MSSSPNRSKRATTKSSSPLERRVLFEGTDPVKTPPAWKKTIILIRHGQSRGQTANREKRRIDKSLLDCGLTRLGIDQANLLPDAIGSLNLAPIELTISSPLTRALQTALIGLPDTPIMIAYDLREVGSMIPENIPRPINKVLKDLSEYFDADNPSIDTTTLRPEMWPSRHDTPPKVVRNDRIRTFFAWLASRPEQTIAVVCHYHVIRTALSSPYESSPTAVRPQNCEPIVCDLDESGNLSLRAAQV